MSFKEIWKGMPILARAAVIAGVVISVESIGCLIFGGWFFVLTALLAVLTAIIAAALHEMESE